MARLFCVVALLIAVIAVSQAAPPGPKPALDMTEKEDLLRELMDSKDFKWRIRELYERLYPLETTGSPTTTQAPTTTEEPEQFIADISKVPSQLTTGQICGLAQTLYPPSENVESKRDLVLNMIYQLCLPSVRSDDVEAIALILDFLRGEEQDASEPAGAGAGAETGADGGGDAGSDAETDTGADGGDNAGTENGAGADAGVDTGAGTDAETDAGIGVDTGVDAGTDAETDAGAGVDTGAGAEAGADTGVTAETAPAKRTEDAEFLKLLLKAVENENEKRRLRRKH